MTDSTIKQIATEALKPMSGVIDALLGPRIQRFRNWSKKQELNDRVRSPIIDQLFESYLRKLLRRISGITTIVFPQQTLPLTTIYEPLILHERFDDRPNAKSNFGIKSLGKGKNFLIIDSAGMGKSTFAKHFALELIKDSDKMPIFLELRRLSDNETLLEKIAIELDETKNDIDEEVLRMLLDSGNFVVILDGYDELSEDMRNKVGPQITNIAVRSQNNSIILTTRPEVSLPDLPNSKSYFIKPLTKPQAKSLILKYDGVANIDIGQRLLTEFSSIPENFLKTPLLIALLYKTYGFNQSVATKITSFYDEVYNALYKGHDLSKSGFSRDKTSKLDFEEFRNLLRSFSFILLIRQRNNITNITEGVNYVSEALKLSYAKPQSSRAFFEDLTLAVPFLVRDGTEFRFIHKSIGEFFAAEFLAYHSSSEKVIISIRDGQLKQSFISVFNYLSEVNPSLFRRLIVKPLADSILQTSSIISDPYIRSLEFLSKTHIGLWPFKKYTSGVEGERSRPTFPREKDFNSFLSFPCHYQGEEYIFAISMSSNENQLPLSAWEMITTPVKHSNQFEDHIRNIDGVELGFMLEKWLPITDDRILDIADNKTLRSAFVLALGWKLDWATVIQGSRTRARIISDIACQKLIRDVESENETQEWLEDLLST